MNTESRALKTKQSYTDEEDFKSMNSKLSSKLNSHFDWKKINTELAFKDSHLA